MMICAGECKATSAGLEGGVALSERSTLVLRIVVVEKRVRGWRLETCCCGCRLSLAWPKNFRRLRHLAAESAKNEWTTMLLDPQWRFSEDNSSSDSGRTVTTVDVCWMVKGVTVKAGGFRRRCAKNEGSRLAEQGQRRNGVLEAVLSKGLPHERCQSSRGQDLMKL